MPLHYSVPVARAKELKVYGGAFKGFQSLQFIVHGDILTIS